MNTTQYPQLAILIPCLNEEAAIQQAIEASSHFGQVFVIDNGSTDASYSIAKKVGAVVIRENRQGYGNAIMTGLLEAKRHNKEIALILDADLSDDPSNIPLLVEPLLQKESELVLSARTRKEDQKNLEVHQRFGNQLAVYLIKILTGYQYRDMGPFRAFWIDTILKFPMVDENFGWNIEMQIKAVSQGLSIQEIELPYRKRIAGQSKISGNIRNSMLAGKIILQSAFKYALSQKSHRISQ